MKMILPVLLAATLIASAHAQDTRQVGEPALPPACAVLVSTRTGPESSAQDDSERIAQAVSRCPAGQSVRLAASNQYTAFTAGPLTLASGVTLVVEAGATLYASSDPARYDRGRKTCGSTDSKGNGCRPFITAENTQGGGIMGAGVIDGQGGQVVQGGRESWWQIARRAQAEKSEQNVPRLIEVNRSKDFTLYRITLRNSPNFHITLHEVDGFTAWGLRIDTPALARNTDGIDPISSRNVTIAHSFIRTGDDNVAIKAGSAGPSEHVSIIDNHFYSGHGMSIGSETQGGVRHVRVQDLSMEGTTSGLRIKSDESRGGRVDDVLYRNVCLRDVKTPIDISAHYTPGARGNLTPIYEDIRFEDIHSLGGGRLVLQGHDARAPLKASFRNVQVDGHPELRIEHALLSPAQDDIHARGPDCEQRFPDFPLIAVPVFRPRMSAAQAGKFTYAEVLGYAGAPGHEAIDPWDPLAEAKESGPPDYVVDRQALANGHAVFKTVQAAVDRAIVDAHQAGSKPRVRILIEPGIYRELVYVPKSAVAITLEGDDANAAATVITAGLDAAVTGRDYAAEYGAQFAGTDAAIQAMYESLKTRATLSTFGSYTVWVRNAGFQARNLTIENAFRRAPLPSCVEDCRAATAAASIQHQAVALAVDGADRSAFENVRLLGLQDTLYLKTQEGGRTARSFFDRAYIEGDVDFIFGDATAFFQRCEIKSLGSRRNSYVGAPDTNIRSKYGLVFDHCEFTNDGSEFAREGKYNLARQWFHNQKCTPFGAMVVPGYACTVGADNRYEAGKGTIDRPVLETVGKMVVTHSRIGNHIDKAHPWADWNQSGKLSYRPVQTDSDAYWAHLLEVRIDPIKDLGEDAKPVPPQVFLGEFDNRGEE